VHGVVNLASNRAFFETWAFWGSQTYYAQVGGSGSSYSLRALENF